MSCVALRRRSSTRRGRVRLVVKQKIVHLVDDLDGGTADETIAFGLDGQTYEIDLSGEHCTSLREQLSTYVAAARRTGSSSTPRRRRGGSTDSGGPHSRAEAKAIREWARTSGYQVSNRGRIPSAVVRAYRETADEPRPTPMPAQPSSSDAPGSDVAPAPSESEPSDADVLAWHESKNYKIPENRVVNGLMRHRYRTAHSTKG